MSLVVYGSSLSPFVRKVLVFAAEKGLEVENVVAGPGAPPPEGFAEASPFGKIPALRHGGYTLADSSAIVHYLEALRPEPRLIPAEPQARGRAVWFDEFADTVLFATGGKIFWNRVAGPLTGSDHDVSTAERAEAEELPSLLTYLEGQAPAEAWLLGEAFTLADVAVGSIVVNNDLAGVRVDAAAHPRLHAYLQRVHARPSFRPIVESNHAFVDRFGDRLRRRA